MFRLVLAVFVAALVLLTPLPLANAAPEPLPVEDHASYQPGTRCAPKAKPGTVMLGRHLVRKYGGGFGPISRRCGGSRSEHTEGRAFDWTLDARRTSGRRTARAFLNAAFATGRTGERHQRARRMGIMYVIWNDRMYGAWNDFRPERYLSSSCSRRATCSATLRHRDHVHVSLTRKAGRARTSWYLRRTS